MWKKRNCAMGQTTKMEIPAVCDEQLVPSFYSGFDYRTKIILVQELIIEEPSEIKEQQGFSLIWDTNLH
jgi:hypothetical protein